MARKATTKAKVPAVQTRGVWSLSDQKGWQQLELYWSGGLKGSSSVTLYDALRQSAILACVDRIAKDVSKPSLRLVRNTGRGNMVVTPREHWLARLLALDPNQRHHWGEFIEFLTYYLALEKNVIVYKKRASIYGDPRELIPIQPSRITINATSEEIYYDVSARTEQERQLLGFSTERLTEDDLIHIRARVLDGLTGASTVTLGADTIHLTKQMVAFESALFENGAAPSGAVQFPKDKVFETEAQFQRFREQFEKAYRGASKAGSPIILEDGAEWVPFTVDAGQKQFIQAREMAVAEAARLFGMPPHKIGHMDQAKYSNVEGMEKTYTDDVVVPVCLDLERALTRSLLTEDERLNGLRLAFDRDEIYFKDAQAREERLKTDLQYGVIDTNEARARRGLNPVDDNQNFRLIPVNMAIVRSDGTVQVLTSKPESEGNTEEPEADEDKPDPADDEAEDEAK